MGATNDPSGESRAPRARLAELLDETRGGQGRYGDDTDTRDVEEIELLCFGIHDELYALATEEVRSIARRNVITELPRSPAYIVGISNHQGQAVAVLDLALFEGRARVERASRVIVIEAGELSAAVPVTEIFGIRRIAVDSVERPSFEQEPRRYVSAVSVWDRRAFCVLDAALLLASVRERVAKQARVR